MPCKREARLLQVCCWVMLPLLVVGPLLAAEPKTIPAADPKTVVAPDTSTLAQITGFPKEAEVFANYNGFCLDLGCGDGVLSAEIAQKTKFTVFAIAKDESDCNQTRQTLDKANLYGSRATAVPGSFKKLPFPKGYGNLIVTGEYPETLDLKEVFRVLSPNGLAVIGGGKTDIDKLKAALDAAAIPDYKVSSNYAVFRGKMPRDVSDWTHFTPRPDNINTSRETTVRPPFRTQWILHEPLASSHPLIHAAIVQGRVIFRDTFDYYAWDTFNGALLWTRSMAKKIGTKNGYNTNAFRHALVDGIYYGIENEVIVALDAATGEPKKEFGMPDYLKSGPWTYTRYAYVLTDGNERYREEQVANFTGVYWWWLAVEDGMLYALARTPTQEKCVTGLADLLCAFNVNRGELVWKYESKLPIITSSGTLGGGRLYFCTFEKEEKGNQGLGVVHAFDGKTGVEQWHADVGRVVRTETHEAPRAGYIDEKIYVWWCINDKQGRDVKALDARTGKEIRQYSGWPNLDSSRGVCSLLFTQNKIYFNRGPRANIPDSNDAHEYDAIDLATGAPAKTGITELGKKAGCGAGSASENCIYAGGQNGSVSDLLTGKVWNHQYFRSPCALGPPTANGLFFHFPNPCQCQYPISSPIAMAPAGLDWAPPDAATDMASRVVPGPAFETPLLDDVKEEWTHYRGNSGHTGETSTAPRMPLALKWERKLNGPLTQASFGGGLAYVASREGAVWGLDQQTGDIRWKFLCGAGVRVTPSFGRGRVFIGSEDGWVYCLEAKSGQLAWRFRAAPEEYYVNIAGRLKSIWPVSAGVVLDNNTAYCASGLIPFDGTYLYGLDIKTGKPAWAKLIGDAEKEEGAPQGIMALSEETLVVPVYMAGGNAPIFKKGGNQGYRKTDGEKIGWYAAGTTGPYPRSLGSEAIADKDVFLFGGPRYFQDRPWPAKPFELMDMKTGWACKNSDRSYMDARPAYVAPMSVAPVLGHQVIVGDGAAYDRAKYCEAVRNKPREWNTTKIWSVPFWATARQVTSSLALAGDVVLAGGTSEVVAFEAKENGKELSRVTIPGQVSRGASLMLRNSLAVTNGRVFVVTEAGSVLSLGGD